MRVRWIDEECERLGIPRARVVEAVPGMTATKMSLVMSGQRKLSADEADTIRRFFGYRLPDDPVETDADRIHQQLQRLNEDQLPVVALYLEALTGKRLEPRRAS